MLQSFASCVLFCYLYEQPIRTSDKHRLTGNTVLWQFILTIFFMYALLNLSSTEDGVGSWWSACCDPVWVALWPAAPREPVGQAEGTSCCWVCSSGYTALVYYSRGSPGIQLMANIKAVHIRTARMWVEVISNEFCLLYGTNAFSALHACSLSIHTAIEHSLFLFKSLFSPAL